MGSKETKRAIQNLMQALRYRAAPEIYGLQYLHRFNPAVRPTEKQILAASDRFEADGELQNASEMRRLARMERERRKALRHGCREGSRENS